MHATYPSLKWSHFYAALNWDDAPECLQWADENQSTVAEMKAWRRALRGEDLTVDAANDEWGVAYVPSEAVAVKDPAEFEDSERRGRTGRADAGFERSSTETVAGVARDSAGSGGSGGDSGMPRSAAEPAVRPPKSRSAVAVAPRPQLSPGTVAHAECPGTLERINEALTPEVLKAFKTLPEKKRTRFLKAVSGLSTKTARLI